MAIEFGCTACGATLRVPDEAAGRLVRCRKCQATFRAPTPPPSPPATIANEWVPDPEPLPVAEELPADEPTIPDEVLVPAEEVPPPKPRPRPSKPPRRPRRREREPEPAASPITRMLVTLSIIAIVAGVGLGVLVWRSAFRSAEWRPHPSPGGGFTVEMPAGPRDDIGRRIGFPPMPGTTVEGTVHRRLEYAVIWADFPGGRNVWATDDQIIDSSVQGMRTSAPEARIEPREPVTVSGFRGREVVVTMDGEGTYVFRVIVAETRLFLVAAGGRGGGVGNPDVRRFIDSFEVTDTRILATARRKAEATENARLAEEKRREDESRREEERRTAEERRLAGEKRREDERRAEEERKRREDEAAAEAARRVAEAEAAKFRAPQPGLSAPDPTTLPGLRRYLGFEEITGDDVAVWPKESGTVPRGATTGPGVRGKALYLAANPRGTTIPNAGLPQDFARKAFTVAGWAKVADGATIELFRAGGARATVAVGLSPARAWGGLATGEQHPDERGPGTLSGTAGGGKWCHVAYVRVGSEGGNRAILYIDGAPVATYTFATVVSPFINLAVGVPELAATKGDIFYRVPHPDLPVAAVDEVCLFDRPLTANEVRYLAGKGKSPDGSPAQAVRLAPHAAVEPLAGVAFDPDRKAVWAITAVRPYWEAKVAPAPVAGSQQGFLVKYTYPDFTPAGRWALPPVRIGNRDWTPTGGPPVLDAKNNRLFLPVYNWTGNTHLQKEAERFGTYYRFDLDALPESTTDAPPPVLTVAAKMADRGAGQRLGDAVVSPDGKWLYFHDPAAWPPNGQFGTPVCRIPADLKGTPEQIVVPGLLGAPRPLWLSADGKTIRTIQHGRRTTSVGPDESGVAEIDAAAWTVGKLLSVPALHSKQAYIRIPIAVHSDGRVLVGGPTGLLEYDPTGDVRRLRPVVVAPTTFLRASADGRFLFAADAELPRNRLALFDARKNPDRPDELTVLEEDVGLRVGGPFDVSPDGRFVVFRSGLVVRLDEGDAARKPLPKWVPPTGPKVPVAVVPKPKDPGEIALLPKNLAPMPRVKVTALGGPPEPVVPAGDIKGLRFHLACDAVENGAVRESVSGKLVGTSKTAELIDGPRGKAIRVTTGGPVPATREGLKLSDQTDSLAVGAGKPFTLAVWVQTDDWNQFNAHFVYGMSFVKDTFRVFTLTPGSNPKGVSLNLQESTAGAPPPAGRPRHRWELSATAEWIHLSVSRDEKGVVRFGVNGEFEEIKTGTFAGEFRFTDLALGRRIAQRFTAAFDEFCLFDRVLTDDEIRRLAGRPVKK